MPRCVACDCYLTDTELLMDGPDGNFEDMCFTCRGIAYNPDSVDYEEYEHGSITELMFFNGITAPKLLND